MVLELLRGNDKRVLENLAVEFGDDFLNKCNGNKKVIGLYGANERILNLFKTEIKNYFSEKREFVLVVSGEVDYNIDIGFFLKSRYFKGLNKDLEGLV